MKPFLKLNASIDLKKIAKALQQQPFRQMRHHRSPNTFNCNAMGISLDYSHQTINDEICDLLIALAHERELPQAVESLMHGKKINTSENKPALHTALRSFDREAIIVDGHDIIPDILEAREKMRDVVTRIRAGEWVGYTNKRIEHIVNIGIGGSDLGPRFCLQALHQVATKSLQYHFISDADPHAFHNTVSKLNPETTLFIIASKSFTTPETLYNAKKAMQWVHHRAFHKRHFIAVTARPKKAADFGITHIIDMWDWVGGRYSLCSAINLITAIAIGFDQFSLLLAGANKMDQHFRQEPVNTNLPMMSGLLGIWNINFLNIHNLLILTYLHQLEQFVAYVQQLDMESNGKSIDVQNKPVDYATGPIVWGGPGNRAQHSYYQLLCQGTHRVAAELITVDAFNHELIHDLFMNNLKTLTQGHWDMTNLSRCIPGGNPLSHIHLKDCNPATIGALIALYEHKIFVQSVIWNINAFDQPGVESAKRIYGIPSMQAQKEAIR